MSDIYDFDAGVCAGCGAEMTAGFCSEAGAEPPEPGDLSICLACSTPMRFGADLKLVAMTDQEVAELPPSVRYQVVAAQKSANDVRSKIGRKAQA